ncbi:hypothetical protein [Corynebacterium glutamicum]|uniref:hypothetical protein n=1 Tax=Corynebacterium glutamicum TaxID=1718 RepID=UPI002163CE05|nr:hypothetical protein [Corynebacterium glutamicum]
MNNTPAWLITQDDSEDLGFAFDCLIVDAITLDELKEWIYRVIVEMDEFPDYLIDITDVSHKHDLILGYQDIVGFWPYSTLKRTEETALVGIAYARFPDTRDDSISRGKARSALEKSTGLKERFARHFPTISIPVDTGDAADILVSGWWLSGSKKKILTASEIQTLFINQLATGPLSTQLETATGLKLQVVTNRERMKITLIEPNGTSGHAIDPQAGKGSRGGFLLDNGQEDEYDDVDTVTIPDALNVIGYILTHGTPPQEGWKVDVLGR